MTGAAVHPGASREVPTWATLTIEQSIVMRAADVMCRCGIS